jgi:hypothetical protein
MTRLANVDTLETQLRKLLLYELIENRLMLRLIDYPLHTTPLVGMNYFGLL